MELMAAISALEALKKPCVVDLTTDSQYVRQGITGWIHGWKKKRLAHLGQEAGQERRSVAAPRRRAKTASGQLALDQGPRRPRGKTSARISLAREGVAMAKLK